MEPMNTTAHVREDGSIEVWTPTQIANIAQTQFAELAGIPPEKVTVHLMLSGGSFGRRYQWDYLAESYQVAKEMKQFRCSCCGRAKTISNTTSTCNIRINGCQEHWTARATS